VSGLGIVTGGVRGIGLGIVRALLGEGVCDEVAVLDAEPSELAEAKVYPCDVTDEASVQRALKEIGAIPRVLVNNVGGGKPDKDAIPFDPWPSVERWRETVDLNLTAAFVVTRNLGPKLTHGAAICNTASIAGLMPGPLFAYGAAKAALIHWTKSLALALAPQGVRVNAVAPGFVYTRLWAQLADRALFDQMVGASVPLKSEQTPEDIGSTVAFLCSDKASQVTGQVIAIDGGSSAGRPWTT
jgi:3-oxoacyl-[acyl-carrier protein] reductase